MKMRKIVCSFMISVVCFMTAISGVSATSYDTSKINAAYSKVVEYYKNNNNLNNADKILAVESLGLEAESNQFDISSVCCTSCFAKFATLRTLCFYFCHSLLMLARWLLFQHYPTNCAVLAKVRPFQRSIPISRAMATWIV